MFIWGYLFLDDTVFDQWCLLTNCHFSEPGRINEYRCTTKVSSGTSYKTTSSICWCSQWGICSWASTTTRSTTRPTIRQSTRVVQLQSLHCHANSERKQMHKIATNAQEYNDIPCTSKINIFGLLILDGNVLETAIRYQDAPVLNNARNNEHFCHAAYKQ